MIIASAKLYPTPGQLESLERFLCAGRWLFNRLLDHRIKAYRRRGESVNKFQQSRLLTEMRGRMPFLRSVPAQVERDAVRRIDRAFRAFFAKVKAGDRKCGFPRFKGGQRWNSFEVLQPGKYIRPDSRIFVPGIGPIKCRGLPVVNGRACGVRVVRRQRGWIVQLIVDDGPPPEKRFITKAIGVDVGLTHFAVLSDGAEIENPRWLRVVEKKLSVLQRRVTKKCRGSNRRKRAVARLAKFYEIVTDTRRDWMHKLIRKLVDEFDLIAIEDLNVKGLARTRLAKSVHDASWGKFTSMLMLKAESAGATVIKVDPRGTTQDCSACGVTVPKSLGDREHACKCGYVASRDVNAARNILARATGEFTRGESASAGGDACRSPRRGSSNREDRSALQCVK